MGIKDFVSTVLVEICAGICAAQDHPSAEGAIICPPFDYSDKGIPFVTIANPDSGMSFVHFDIAVTVSSSASQEGKGRIGCGLKILEAQIGKNVTDHAETSRASRVRFEIPVKWPSEDLDSD
jgi:hypothetical protein